MKKPIVGVLALQGAVREHLSMLERCGARGVYLKYPAGLQLCRGIAIPGGENATIGKPMAADAFLEEIGPLVRQGMPIYATCAGLILLASRIAAGGQPLLGLMDITASHNPTGARPTASRATSPSRASRLPRALSG